MQVILGSGGVIGNDLSKELQKYTDFVRLVSRNPKRVNSTDQLMSADLTSENDTLKAVEGADVAYLTIGLPYKIKEWEEKWPIIMKNVINACHFYNCKLVFFDNVYMYGLMRGKMTEETPDNPCSRKGVIRKNIADTLKQAWEEGKVKAQIARAADFYGPGATNSVFNILIFENIKKGKKPSWMANANLKHSFTYTHDAAKATAILGNTDAAYNQIWHLPTHKDALSGKEYIELATKEMGVSHKFSVIKSWVLKIGGLFNPMLKELVEMNYQLENEYLFDSSKFEKHFDFQPTAYQEGIKQMVNLMERE
jgi:nucleoside-diphosphate-sugar epimerase